MSPAKIAEHFVAADTKKAEEDFHRKILQLAGPEVCDRSAEEYKECGETGRKATVAQGENFRHICRTILEAYLADQFSQPAVPAI